MSADPRMVYHIASIREQLQEAMNKIEEVQQQRSEGILPEGDEELTVVLVWMTTRAIATFEMMLLSFGSKVDRVLPEDWRQTISHPNEVRGYGKDLDGFLEGAHARLGEIQELYDTAYHAWRQEAALGEDTFIDDNDLFEALENWKLDSLED